MKLRHCCWTVFGLIFSVAGAWAQSTDIIEQIKAASPQERAEAQAEVLVDVLDLSPEQVEQLVEINLKYSTQIQQLLDKGVQDTVLFTSIQEFSRRKDSEIKDLLTKEQVRRYEAHKANLEKIVEDVIQKRDK